MPLAIRHILQAHVCCFFLAVAAHAADLTGKVTSAEGGETLGKVQVSVVGTTLSTATAKDGTFHIANAPAGNQTLQISAVGYRSISVPFESPQAGDIKDFAITLLPDNFQRTDKVEVHADIFQSPEWPAVGDMTLTSSELQQTATVIANDPFRSIQAMPGVSASGNNELLAQFSVMGAPFEQVGIYVDDVFVPNLLHTVPDTRDAPNLSLLTGNDVADLRLLPVAYPVRYADTQGAAVVIRTREGDLSPPLIHASVGMATSEFLGQGAFGPNHKATWLIGARKSYIGYLERYFAATRFSEDGFYDANLKLTYQLTPSQILSLYATGGELGINDPHPPTVGTPQDPLKNGTSNLAVARLGWKWAASPKLLFDTRLAFVRTGFDEERVLLHERVLHREWSVGSNLSWNWRPGAILQAGYSLRKPHANFAIQSSEVQPPVTDSERISDVRQDFYIQQALPLWRDRIHLEGGLRWAKLNTEREQPVTGQASVSFRLASNTTLEAGWGRYAQLPARGGVNGSNAFNNLWVGYASLPGRTSHYIAAVEQRLGERTRLRFEVFDRQNEGRADIYTAPMSSIPLVFSLVERSVLISRYYSRGMQVLLQRRSENRLSGWIGYTYTQARLRYYSAMLPPPFPPNYGLDTPYEPTDEDQPHTVNIFGSYRFKPSIRFSAKALYGSGFPLNGSPFVTTVQRLGPYERLDLRGEKSWTFNRWKLSLYTEFLNITAHDNRRLTSNGGTSPGFPFIPTAGLGFDF